MENADHHRNRTLISHTLLHIHSYPIKEGVDIHNQHLPLLGDIEATQHSRQDNTLTQSVRLEAFVR